MSWPMLVRIMYWAPCRCSSAIWTSRIGSMSSGAGQPQLGMSSRTFCSLAIFHAIRYSDDSKYLPCPVNQPQSWADISSRATDH